MSFVRLANSHFCELTPMDNGTTTYLLNRNVAAIVRLWIDNLANTTRLCTYVVRDDTGLAPNPFCGWCSLAVCTPNYQGIRLEPGDWIAGCLTKARDHRLVYAMEVEEVLDLDAYFKDPRFQIKKPDLRGDWKKRCGDNFYSRAADGSWVQHRNRFHIGIEAKEKDTRFARVFLGQRFYYRGQLAAASPAKFAPLFGGRGARVNHDPSLAKQFMGWVSEAFEPGVAADPNDNPDISDTSGRGCSTDLGCGSRPIRGYSDVEC